jgi:four helix bundle protein
MGSASELENHLLLAKDLRFLEEPSYRDIESRVIETKKMLAALIKKVEADRRQ